MNRSLKAVILAAGKSTRMKSTMSKMVHSILGKEIINFLLDSLLEIGLEEKDIVIVVGENENEIRGVVKKQVQYAVQELIVRSLEAVVATVDDKRVRVGAIDGGGKIMHRHGLLSTAADEIVATVGPALRDERFFF